MRNRFVHGYWQISPRIVMATAQHDIPRFLAAVREVERSIAESSE